MPACNATITAIYVQAPSVLIATVSYFTTADGAEAMYSLASNSGQLYGQNPMAGLE